MRGTNTLIQQTCLGCLPEPALSQAQRPQSTGALLSQEFIEQRRVAGTGWSSQRETVVSLREDSGSFPGVTITKDLKLGDLR